MVKQNDNNENQERENTQETNVEEMQHKDQRGGNHNPEGANQFTEGRVDDRGRKEAEAVEETKQRGANQYTEGRNDDRGRKE